MILLDNFKRSFIDKFEEYFNWADSIDIVVAFLRNSGIALLEEKKLDWTFVGSKSRFIVGGDFGYTEHEAITKLIKFGADIKLYNYSAPQFLDR